MTRFRGSMGSVPSFVFPQREHQHGTGCFDVVEAAHFYFPAVPADRHASDLLMSETLAMRSPLEPRTTQGHSRNASPYRATSDIWTTGSMAEKFGWSSVIWAPCWPNAAWKSSSDSKWN